MSTTETFPAVSPSAVRAILTITDGEIHVEAHWEAPVDRPRAHGWLIGPHTPAKSALAARLINAINAGVIFPNPVIKTDINGKTYVQASSTILARHMNAELKRLGF